MTQPKAITIVSGGLDSTVLTYMLHKQGWPQHLISFDYGQRHVRELTYAEMTAARLGLAWDEIDLSSVTQLFTGSALTDESVDVPEGHYADESMKATVVPNRNAIMLSIAWGVAVAEGADAVVYGAHSGDHPIYPDCRPDFVNALNYALQLGTEGYRTPGLTFMTPFIDKDKTDIVRLGAELDVDMGRDTWSCYQGGDVHCGRCGTCYERREAFKLAGVTDSTRYAADPLPV